MITRMKMKMKYLNKPAHNERFGAMAGVPRLKVGEKQQVTWLVASAGSPSLRQAATTLAAIAGQRVGNRKRKIDT
jgi:hypothetical protein